MSLIEPIPLRVFRYLAAHWRTVAILVAILVIAVVAGLWTRSCSQRAVKLDEAEIQKGKQAIAEQDDKALREVLVASDVREAQRKSNVIEAEANTANAYYESRKVWDNANISEMQAEFDRRNQ